MVTLMDPSGNTRVTVERTGATIASIRTGGTELLWRSPWADEEWDGQYPARDSNAEFHARYSGGWHTLVPNAGDAFDVDGVAHPFHGEACWRPWQVVDSGEASCTLRIVLRTAPLTVERRVEARADGVVVTQEVTSYGADDVSFTWVEHPTFGPALIGPGTTVTVGGRQLGLEIPGPDATHAAMTVVDAGTARISSPAGDLTAELTFDTGVFPLVQVWQEHRAQRGYPWWGVVDALAVEPSAAAYDARSEGDPLGPLTLAPGQRLSATLGLRVETR
ncbi:MAG: hypothetical protein FWE15_15445 [Actinomycetia bacterium]|nr:hypothetical protein [Actinomycetes bacterium]